MSDTNEGGTTTISTDNTVGNRPMTFADMLTAQVISGLSAIVAAGIAANAGNTLGTVTALAGASMLSIELMNALNAPQTPVQADVAAIQTGMALSNFSSDNNGMSDVGGGVNSFGNDFGNNNNNNNGGGFSDPVGNSYGGIA